MSLFTIADMANLYLDAIVADDNQNVLFLSAWGLDTAIQEFLAKLTLSPYEGGLKHFYVEGNDYSQRYHVEHADRLIKHTGRAAKDSLFGDLIHLWLHDPLTIEIDYANRRCVLLRHYSEPEEKCFQRVWQTVQAVCAVPLLAEWYPLVKEFQAFGWVKKQTGMLVDAYQLDFSSAEVEQQLSQWVKSGALTLPKKTTHLSIVP